MKPNTVIGTFSGVGAAELLISSQYLDYEVRYSGPTSGIMTLRAKHDNGAVFESVNNGKVDLSISKTIRIQGYQLDAMEFTIAPEQAFTVTVKQRNGDTER